MQLNFGFDLRSDTSLAPLVLAKLVIFNSKSPFMKNDCSRSNLDARYYRSVRYFVASFLKIILYTDLTIRPNQLF
jgi:hypothetical protein